MFLQDLWLNAEAGCLINRYNPKTGLCLISLQSFHLTADPPTKRIFLKGDIALLVTGQVFSASQTALPISWLAGVQLQLEHT